MDCFILKSNKGRVFVVGKKGLKISIITVCLNSAGTMEQTIQSVISQGYPNIEYIIIDGGSTDGTLDIIYKYEKYIARWISEPDAGIYDAMNKGIKMATGDYISFLNSDDWYTKEAICYVAHDIMQTEMSIACYGANLCSGNEVRKWDNKFAEDMRNIRYANFYCHQAVFAKRCIYEEQGGFDLKYKISADYEWLLRMYDNGLDISYKNYAVVNFRLGGLSSSQEAEMAKEAKEIALLALIKLKDEKKISEKEYDKINLEIEEYYDKVELDRMIKLAVNDVSSLKEDDIKKELHDLLPEGIYSIFGCGNYGQECYKLLQKSGYQVENFWDNDPKKWKRICNGLLVQSPNEIRGAKSVIIISVLNHVQEIHKQLQKMGLKENKDYMDYHGIRRKMGAKLKKYCQ